MLKVQINRASKNFQQAAANINQDWPDSKGNAVFSYWCKFYGENPDEQSNSVKLLEAEIYNKLESKSSVSRLLQKHGIQDVFPSTFTSVSDAMRYTQAQKDSHQEPVNIWFVKPFHLSGGRDIQVVATADLPDFTLPKYNIIQAGVEDIQLNQWQKIHCAGVCFALG